MRLRVLAVGKARPAWVREAVDLYLKRLKHYGRVELVELRASRAGGSRVETQRAVAAEGERILAALSPRERLFALDERGKQVSTDALAKKIDTWLNDGRQVALAIGGPFGLDSRVVERAEHTLALSRLTLPHQLARVLLLEQLYRAFTLLRGEPYHNP